jgi:hypothetical protein
MYKASRHELIARIARAGTPFSPLPCQARHGYMVSNAHHVEVKVGTDGSASAPPSGAVAAAPPAGALGPLLVSPNHGIELTLITRHTCILVPMY